MCKRRKEEGKTYILLLPSYTLKTHGKSSLKQILSLIGKKLIALLNEQKGLSNHDDTSVSLNIGVSGTRMTNVGTTTIYHPNIDDRKTYNQKGAEADQKLLLLSQLE